MTSQQPYIGNNSSDYQPPTDNPQTTQANLQPTGETSTVESETGVSQQSLPATNKLKVVVVQDGSTSSSVGFGEVQVAKQTWTAPFWGTIILLLIGFVVWMVRLLAKEEVPQLSKTLEEAIKEPLIEQPKPEPAVKNNAKNLGKKKNNQKRKRKK